MTEVVYVPLCLKDGQVAAYALIDGDDEGRVMRWKWSLDRGRDRDYVRGKPGMLHRFVMGVPVGDPRRVDHRNRNPLDNRKGNLRIATDAENAQNQGARARVLRPSKYRGVVWDQTRGKWRAQAMLDGKCHNLGRFDDELEAHRVVSEFRRLNMPFSEEAAA